MHSNFSSKNKHSSGIGAFFALAFILAFSGGCAKSPEMEAKSTSEKMWGSERVCLPCHLYQQPIARQHNYRCDTCHQGNPWATAKEEAHFELIRSPQAPENISKTCDKCHRRVLGRDVPYNAEFIKDVIVSHKETAGQWEGQ